MHSRIRNPWFRLVRDPPRWCTIGEAILFLWPLRAFQYVIREMQSGVADLFMLNAYIELCIQIFHL